MLELMQFGWRTDLTMRETEEPDFKTMGKWVVDLGDFLHHTFHACGVQILFVDTTAKRPLYRLVKVDKTGAQRRLKWNDKGHKSKQSFAFQGVVKAKPLSYAGLDLQKQMDMYNAAVDVELVNVEDIIHYRPKC